MIMNEYNILKIETLENAHLTSYLFDLIGIAILQQNYITVQHACDNIQKKKYKIQEKEADMLMKLQIVSALVCDMM